MDNPEVIAKIKYYEEQITILKTQLNDTKEHLKKYTAPSNMKKYYENLLTYQFSKQIITPLYRI